MSKKASNNDSGYTSFGSEWIPEAEKASRVAQVFDSVASQYDLMNDLMSLGSHRLLKHWLVDLSAVRPKDTVLDLAGGTGDLSMLFADRLGPEGRIILSDINLEMLHIARDRLMDRGYAGVDLVQADAEALPFSENSLDLVVLAFGLRNMTRKEKALAAIRKCLKPSGRLLILEFSKPRHKLTENLFNFYSGCWPLLGKLVTGDDQPYRYLVESIERHPNQEALKLMLTDADFDRVRYHSIMDGVVAFHIGFKPA